MVNYVLTYLFIGVIFNLLFDLLVNWLGEEHEDSRFTMAEWLVATLTWPIALTRFIIAFFTNLK